MVKILTDSSAELRSQEYRDLGVMYFSHIISQGDREFKDAREISGRDLFKGLEEGKVYSSAQVPLYDYLSSFEDLASRGQEFIYISLSSGISGAYETASLALERVREKYPRLKMGVLDSRGASVGQGLIVRKMAEAAGRGRGFEELLELGEFLQENIRHGLVVPDLDHLARGGRLKKSQLILGNLMGIIPLIEFDREGNLLVVDKVRGRKKALRYFLDRAIKENPNLEEINIVYSQARDLESLEKEAQNLLPGARLESWELGCVIGLHTGPGALGLAYLSENLPSHLI